MATKKGAQPKSKKKWRGKKVGSARIAEMARLKKWARWKSILVRGVRVRVKVTKCPHPADATDFTQDLPPKWVRK